MDLGFVTIETRAFYHPPNGEEDGDYILEEYSVRHELELRCGHLKQNHWFEVLRPEIDRILRKNGYYFYDKSSRWICSTSYKRQNTKPFENLARIQAAVSEMVEHYADLLHEQKILRKITEVEKGKGDACSS